MNSHIQLNENDEFLRFIPAGIPIVWDENNYCSAFALEADVKAAQFKVFPFYTSAPPAHNADTQKVQEINPVKVGDAWVQQWEVIDLTPEQITEKRFARDQARYKKRTAVKDELIAWMAADNMSRVRSGAWTVSDLTALLADPAVAAANQFMSTLSFELAAQAIASASTPLLTPEIRADWIARLQEHFYLEG